MLCATAVTIKELDDVCKVHVIFQDNVSIRLHERQSDEEHKVFRGCVLGRPDGFPQREHVIVYHLCPKKKPEGNQILSDKRAI